LRHLTDQGCRERVVVHSYIGNTAGKLSRRGVPIADVNIVRKRKASANAGICADGCAISVQCEYIRTGVKRERDVLPYIRIGRPGPRVNRPFFCHSLQQQAQMRARRAEVKTPFGVKSTAIVFVDYFAKVDPPIPINPHCHRD
jgi:hypothetical protein